MLRVSWQGAMTRIEERTLLFTEGSLLEYKYTLGSCVITWQWDAACGVPCNRHARVIVGADAIRNVESKVAIGRNVTPCGDKAARQIGASDRCR